MIAIEVPSRIVTRVIGKAGRMLAALPDFDNVEEAEAVAIAAIVIVFLVVGKREKIDCLKNDLMGIS